MSDSSSPPSLIQKLRDPIPDLPVHTSAVGIPDLNQPTDAIAKRLTALIFLQSLKLVQPEHRIHVGSHSVMKELRQRAGAFLQKHGRKGSFVLVCSKAKEDRIALKLRDQTLKSLVHDLFLSASMEEEDGNDIIFHETGDYCLTILEKAVIPGDPLLTEEQRAEFDATMRWRWQFSALEEKATLQ